MKLLLISLLFPLITWGQKFIPIKQYGERHTYFIDSSFSYPVQYQVKSTYDTLPVIMLVCDNSMGNVYDHYQLWVYGKKGYEVREKHNTSEGQIDAGFCPSCWSDYWKHIEYL